MKFQPYYGKRTEEEKQNIDEDAYEELTTGMQRPRITLTDRNVMVVRNKPATVRVPYFIVSKEPKNFYYSLLLQ